MRKALAMVAILLSMVPAAFADVAMTAPAVVNEQGTAVQNIKVGDKVSIQSALTSNEQMPNFVYIVQVQDRDGYAVFLSWANVTLESGGQTFRVSWSPEKEGVHTVQVFAWSSIEAPASLAMQQSAVDVSAQAANCSGDASCFTGTVTRVIDGDTVVVGSVTVRLTLVNTPERGQAGYSEATAFTAATCPVGSAVLVDEDDGQTGGSFGRMVAKVHCGDKVLNEELLRAGHASIYASYCDDSEFAGEDWAARYGC